MITLDSYIYENARTTQTNVERKEELEKWLKIWYSGATLPREGKL